MYPPKRQRRSSARAAWAAGLALATLCAGVALATLVPGSAAAGTGPAAAPAPAKPGQDDARRQVEAAFAAARIQVDKDGAALAFPVGIEIRGDALEYLLVTPAGAVHESLFVTGVDPEVLAAAFLYIGAVEGRNVEYTPIDPPPTREQVQAGAPTHDVRLPEGEPIFMYAAWREPAGTYDDATGAFESETLHFHRVEDLVLDLERQRTLRRHGWVWLGSRMIPGPRPGDPERFAASATGNLICTTFFGEGDTLVTPALPECASQTIWYPNNWLIPARGSEVMLIASRTELETLPAAFRAAAPFVPEPNPERR